MLKRVLKAWTITEPNHVYWQGLDSVAAAFVSLNVNDESLAFYSFKSFLNAYSKDFFVSDNSALIEEYMQTFQQLIMFHDPHLGLHMCEIGVRPTLFAVPWFLTLFSRKI
jgi:TBC domain-containing protein kinase-like protein